MLWSDSSVGWGVNSQLFVRKECGVESASQHTFFSLNSLFQSFSDSEENSEENHYFTVFFTSEENSEVNHYFTVFFHCH